MKTKILYITVFITILSIFSAAIFAFSIFTNDPGYSRRYIDSDIPFIYKLNDSTPAEYFGPIDAGTQTWENVRSSYFEFDFGGTTPINTDDHDGTNLIFFDFQGVNFSPGTNTIAYSRTWTSGSGSNYQAVESDLVWNARDFAPSPTGAAGQQDLQSVITHEVGHHLGLGHSGPAGGPPGVGPLIMAATMYGFSSSGDTTKRSLHIDDIAGVAAIYPSWILQGTVYDASTGLAFSGVKLSSSDIYGSVVGSVIIDPSSGRAQRPGYYIDSLYTDQIGDYSVVALKQNFDLSASYYGYETQTISISFNNPGGIGQTQTIIQDFQIQPSPLSFISGTVTDSVTAVPVVARIKIFATSQKPGVPGGLVVDTTTTANGDFNITVPSMENYLIVAHPVSPYVEKSFSVENLVQGGINIEFKVNPAKILVVDDDRGKDYEQFYIDDLESQSISYHLWNIQTDGMPTNQIRNGFASKIMIWFTGDSSSLPLTQDEQNEILDHITTGGKLFLTGQDIAEMNSGSIISDTLGVDFAQNSTLSLILGVSGDVVGNGLVFNVSGFGGANNQTSSDIIQITDSTQTTSVFHYGGGNTNPAGIRYENSADSSKVVFLGFGYESINDPSRRQTLLTRILEYLESPITTIDEEFMTNQLPDKFELSQNYPNPFNPVTTIEYTVPEKSQVSIIVFNILGQKIKTLVNKEMSAGNYQIHWAGIDEFGRKVPSGIYYYNMQSQMGFNHTKKLLLLR